MKSIDVLNDETLCEYFLNTEGKLLIVSTPTCSHCMSVVKQIERNDIDACLYRIQEQDSVGADILMNQLELKSVPAAVWAKDGKIDLLINANNFAEVKEWMEQKQ